MDGNAPVDLHRQALHLTKAPADVLMSCSLDVATLRHLFTAIPPPALSVHRGKPGDAQAPEPSGVRALGHGAPGSSAYPHGIIIGRLCNEEMFIENLTAIHC